MFKFIKLVLKDNLLGCPFVPDRRFIIDPFFGSALIGGSGLLSSLVGGLLGSSSQSSANDTNLEITRMNNEVQKQLAREANEQSMLQFNRNMNWLREQYYDTDKVRRDVEAYQRAGLNPYTLAGNTATTVGSVGSPSMSDFKVADTQSGHVEPYFPDLSDFASGLSNAVGSYFQNSLIDSQEQNINADTQQKSIDNVTRVMENLSKIRLTMAEGDKLLVDKSVSEETKKSIKLQNDYLRKQMKVYTKQMSALMKQPYKQNDVLDAEREQLASQTALNYMHVQAVSANIDLTNAQIYSIFQSVKQKWQEVNNDTRLTDASVQEKAQAVVHMLNQDAAVFEEIGISKSLVVSQKFKNYISGIVEGAGSALMMYLGFKGMQLPKVIRGFGHP